MKGDEIKDFKDKYGYKPAAFPLADDGKNRWVMHLLLEFMDKIMKKSHDLGIIIVLLERFQKQRLPRILKIKEKVDNGQCLEELDIEFLKALFADAQNNLPLLHRYTEYDHLARKITFMYLEITEKALQNQKTTGGP
jgi:hypothetical protein